MNREIKFRAWDANAKEMISSETLCDQAWNVLRSISQSNSGNWIYMQLTGLKDKNGTEIYEGDIIEFGFKFFKEKPVKREAVSFEDGAFMPFHDPHYCDGEQGEWIDEETIEVVGNIHDTDQEK